MRHGKYQTKKRPVPVMSWILAAIAVLGLVSGGVVAYLSASTEGVTNAFTADEPTNPVIAETFDDIAKSNVSVNVGNPGYAVYVRAAILVTWKDTNGNVLAETPVAGTDYTIVLNENDWFEHNGFYYHKAIVSSGNTADLIESCTPKTSNPGYALNVQIIAQTIQALGTTDSGDIPAVQDAWGVYVSGSELSPTASSESDT